MEKSLQQRIEETVREEISVVSYNPQWPHLFDIEAENFQQFLSEKYPNDRVAYTQGKTEFVVSTTEKAKRYYASSDTVIKTPN